MIEDAGLVHSPGRIVPNTMRALQLGEYARDAGALDALHPLLFHAYWVEGRDLGDLEVLADLAARAGLDAAAAVAAVEADRFRDRVLGATQAAMDAGVSGVPAWAIDGTLIVPGAQPHEVFDRVMARLGHEPRDAPAQDAG